MSTTTPETPDPVLRQQFLEGMSHTAATVNVVTTDGAHGRAGVTVSAMSSVSADTPRPSLLVCVHHMSAAATAIVENGVFCVNVLRDDQSYISDTFAGRHKTADGDKFSCAEWTTQVTGAPRVVDPLVAFDCRMVSGERVGTHHVFIGEVQEIFTSERGSPLIFSNRSYGTATRIEAAKSIAEGERAVHKKLGIGCFHTFGPYILPDLLERLRREDPAVEIKLVEGDHRRVLESLRAGETDLAVLYDIDLGDDISCETLTELKPYVLLAEGHDLADKSELTPEDLAPEPMVLLEAPPSRDYFLSVFEEAGIEPTIGFRSTSFEMVRGLVGHGLGYALLATKPASAMTYDGRAVVSRPLVTDVEASGIVLARKASVTPSDIAERFAWLCRDVFCLDA